MRAQEKVDREFLLAADEKLHLVVGHDRHRNVGDGHPAELHGIDDAEIDADRLAQQAEECPLEVAEPADRELVGHAARNDRQHRAGIDDGHHVALAVDLRIHTRHVGAADVQRHPLRLRAGGVVDVDVGQRGEIVHVPLLDDQPVLGGDVGPVQRDLEVVALELELGELPGDLGVGGVERVEIDGRSQMPPRRVIAPGDDLRRADGEQFLRAAVPLVLVGGSELDKADVVGLAQHGRGVAAAVDVRLRNEQR